MKTQSKTPTIANVVTKHSISSELAQKMVDEAMAKARQLGVAENVAILDDGGNLKAFGRMDGAPILCIEMAQNKAYTALFGVSTQDFFNFIQGDRSEEHTSELQSRLHLVCRLLLEKKKKPHLALVSHHSSATY